MYFEEYGTRTNPTIVMLHGAFFADSFLKQYSLCENYHLIVPHIMGFGKAAAETFTAEGTTTELLEFIERYAPVYLVGFSLGAQLAFRLVSKRPELFRKAVIISPWLVQKEQISEEMINGNLKMLSGLKNKFYCGIIGLSMGLSGQKRAELIASMQLVSEETVRNSVDNKISFESCPEFATSPVPILAFAGKKESEAIVDSVKQMAKANERCTCELWEGAKHDIPTLHSKQLNEKLRAFFNESPLLP